ncbi:PASTA domain-containing protein, partial [Frankia sp. QA3]|uniref:PASTA domain-containing protein n=1 Tax=Frankia sp. QA3 TaxID=710111 RepID=UPI0018DED7C1
MGGILLATGLVSGCGPSSGTAVGAANPVQGQVDVPNVVGLALPDAKARLAPDLDATSVDATGRKRMQLVDGNWQVVQQDPAAGTRVAKRTTVSLRVAKAGEAAATPGATTPAATTP